MFGLDQVQLILILVLLVIVGLRIHQWRSRRSLIRTEHVTERPLLTRASTRKAEAMSSHLRAVTGEVSPDSGLFIMAEVADGRLAGSAAEGDIEPPDDQIAAGDGGFVIRARYTDHVAHVRFELWNESPPVDAWEELWTGQLLLKSGLVCVTGWEYAGHSPDVEFDLGQRDTTWSARVSTKILQTEQEVGFPQAIARVELYRVRFWT
ncbi:hypothetical protein ACQPYK_00345 [Streptosporangium sp. CA-135522]|uniref:hypothetical protein n=1 Tax=Streptosporangium sp. CA-135522 TaxID=3240072 RepID=UPI003D8F4044